MCWSRELSLFSFIFAYPCGLPLLCQLYYLVDFSERGTLQLTSIIIRLYSHSVIHLKLFRYIKEIFSTLLLFLLVLERSVFEMSLFMTTILSFLDGLMNRDYFRNKRRPISSYSTILFHKIWSFLSYSWWRHCWD